MNLLLHAVNEDAPRHREARAWLQSALSGGEMLGLPWLALLAFLRLSTKPGLFPRPLPISSALDIVDKWLESPAVSILQPGPQHARLLRALLIDAGTGGDLTSDAHLAALAVEHGAELCSLDRDFARFPGLRWRDPLRKPQ
ncbi:type II toxin-antitoxin system VapC family toxin [Silvibacterium bohemicum]|uniref:type II toxin-antitoxin system VapC family toxin n=1 Tax=Silvibacterium bohemicum TaxID=1577686 RepID=UPI0035D45D92